MKKLCRICLKTSIDTVPIFTTTLPSSEKVLATFLAQITNLEINNNDSHPKGICQQCYHKVDDVGKFITQCEKSDKIFKDGLAQSNEDDDDKPLIYLAIKSEPWESVETQMDIDDDTNNDMLPDQTSPLHSPIESDQKCICTVCGKPFRCERLLKRHNKKVCFPLSNIKSEKTRRRRKPAKNLCRKEYQCKMCNKKFAYLSGFRRHTECDPGEQPHWCTLCEQSFTLPTCLWYHERAAHPYANNKTNNLCNTCGQTFSSTTSLKYHNRIHTNERPFMCQICGASFTQNKNLVKHEKRHSGYLAVLCPVCGRKVGSSNHLIVHMRSHTGERPFLCTTCGKGFATKHLLKRHNRVHTGEKPFVCKICGRAFNQTNALKSHENTHIRQGGSYIEVVVKQPDEGVKKSEAVC